jgi:hypothetical protein
VTIRRKKEKISIEFDIEYDEIEWGGGWIPKTVYKYRDWENPDHRKILTETSIWVPDSYDFNDPFDCNIPISYDLICTDEGLAEQYIRKLIDLLPDVPIHEKENLVQVRLQEGKHKDLKFMTDYKNEIFHDLKKRKGIFSVTPINDNILMWSHYANSHKGLCIGFDSAKLFKFLGGGGGINYTNKYPIISPMEEEEKRYILQFLTKSIHWAYEAEYRLTAFFKTNIAIKLPPDVIVEVILGSNMIYKNKEEILNIIKANLPYVKCFSAVPESDSFKLKIVPIEL